MDWRSWSAREDGCAIVAVARNLFEALAERKLRFAVDGLKEREERPAVVAHSEGERPSAPLRVVRAGARSAV